MYHDDPKFYQDHLLIALASRQKAGRLYPLFFGSSNNPWYGAALYLIEQGWAIKERNCYLRITESGFVQACLITLTDKF